MPGFLAAGFALAALVAATGPLLIHLVERRRSRVVAWSAMELLAEALGQKRRKLLVRDRALLVLRTCAIVMFGLAMSRPYWSGGGRAADLRQPLHAVLVIDNSLSMAYEQLDGTLLDAAKSKAARFLRLLSPGSEVSVVPWCGPNDPLSPPTSRAAAERRLAAIEPAGRSANVVEAIDLIQRACRMSLLPAKRVVLFTDQQAIDWPADFRAAGETLPEVQVASLAPAYIDNAWVAELSLPDAVADVAGESLLTAVVRYQGAAPRRAVTAKLMIEGQTVAEQSAELLSGEDHRLQFRHRFVGSSGARSAMVSLEITPDRLPADDRRTLAVPVAAQLPVLFVEDADVGGSRRRADETASLRRLIGETDALGADVPLAAIERTTIDQLTPKILATKRLVVVAGVRDPGDAVKTLHRYVELGGQLLIVAGGGFDPVTWNRAAWLDGEGILPLSLQPQLVGSVPTDGADLEPFWLSPDSIDARHWRLDHLPNDQWQELAREPVFFRYAACTRERQKQGLAGETPNFRILAELSNGDPLLIERNLAAGRIVLFASGLAPEWNTLAQSRAVLLIDRLVRQMLAHSLPRAGQTMGAPAAESDLRPASEARMRGCLPGVPFRRLPPGAEIPLESADVAGADMWRWLMIAMLALLIAEQVIVMVSTRRDRSMPA
ncbi:MAG TPA: BatA domain-containing protein [Pirellulales bacterium]|nr:BatA domain-containing protein [Pirellulales bacterium]